MVARPEETGARVALGSRGGTASAGAGGLVSALASHFCRGGTVPGRNEGGETLPSFPAMSSCLEGEQEQGTGGLVRILCSLQFTHPNRAGLAGYKLGEAVRSE